MTRARRPVKVQSPQRWRGALSRRVQLVTALEQIAGEVDLGQEGA